ncbi:MAG: c-type cytochrome domain-containing protein [Planctomycetota bacterium]|nr:c-type cytochrome domain-containing protein [Planctomycetota bacterium]
MRQRIYILGINWTLALLAAVCLTVCQTVQAAESAGPISIAMPKRDTPVDFSEVQAILAKNCLACHSGSKAEGGLILETPDSMQKGGDSGPAIVPKKGSASLLVLSAAHKNDTIMPPEDNDASAKNLTPEELGLITLWIDQGALASTRQTGSLEWQQLSTSVQPILSAAISQHGDMAAAGRGNRIYVYEVGTGREVAQLADSALASRPNAPLSGTAHLDLVQSLAFSPDGNLLASGGFREIKLWRRSRDFQKGTLQGGVEVAQVSDVTADGQRLATGEANGTIRIWDLTTGKVLQSVSAHAGPVTGVKFSPDGARLFSVSKDKSLKVWKVADGTAIGAIQAPAELNALALVENGTQLATADADNVVRIWAIPAAVQPGEPAKPIKELKGHAAAVTAIASVLPAGKVIVTGGQDGTVRVWNLDNGQVVRQMDQAAPVLAVAVRGDGKRIATSGANNVARLWNGDDGTQIAEIKGDMQDRFKIADLQRRQTLAKGRQTDRQEELTAAEAAAKAETDGIAKSIAARTAAEKDLAIKIEKAKPPAEALTAAQMEFEAATFLSRQGADAASAAKAAAEKEPGNQALVTNRAAAEKSAADLAKALENAKNKLEAATKANQKPAADLSFAYLFVRSSILNIEEVKKSAAKAAEQIPIAKKALEEADAEIKKADAATAAATTAALVADLPIKALAFTADGTALVTGSDNRLVQTWSADNGAPLARFAGQDSPVTTLAIAPSGMMYSAATNKSIAIWNMRESWKLERTIGNIDDPKLIQDRVLTLDFSPDGKQLASGGGEPSRSGELKIWNVADGTLTRTIKDPHSDSIYCVRYSPDGSKLASSGADRFIKIWNVADGTFNRSLEGHTHHVLAIAWNLSGKTLASGSADNTIKVWNARTGEQKKTILGLTKEVTSLAFLADGASAIAGMGDNLVHMYNLDSGAQERNFAGSKDYVYAASASADGKLIVGGGQDGVLRVWKTDTAQIVHGFEPTKQ